MWKNVLQTISAKTFSAIQYQPIRTTFILKRRWALEAPKKGRKPRKLRSRHYVYEMVEDTGIRKPEKIELILTQFVDGFGLRGDRILVKPNIGYERLVLPGLAVYPTEENVAKYALKDKNIVEYSSKTVKRTMNVLSAQILAVVMNMETPWTLEPWHIRASLRKAGIYAPLEAIKIPEKPITGPALELESREFVSTITINNCEVVKVRCRIHLWSTLLKDKLPHIRDHWKMKAEPLFEEEREVLESMPGPFFKNPEKAKIRI